MSFETIVTIQRYPCAGPLDPVARVFVAMDGDKKRSWKTQRETIASLDIGFKGPVLNRYRRSMKPAVNRFRIITGMCCKAVMIYGPPQGFHNHSGFFLCHPSAVADTPGASPCC